MRKTSLISGFDFRTAQPVASYYTGQLPPTLQRFLLTACHAGSNSTKSVTDTPSHTILGVSARTLPLSIMTWLQQTKHDGHLILTATYDLQVVNERTVENKSSTLLLVRNTFRI
jgi:hypothetical protein